MQEYILIHIMREKCSKPKLKTSVTFFPSQGEAMTAYHKNMVQAFSNNTDLELVQVFNHNFEQIRIEYK